MQVISRPLKFGKTFIASMIYQFFSILHKDDMNLFQNLKIWQTSDKYRSKKGAYPVIFLSFHDFQANSIEGFDEFYKKIMSEVYLEYRDILFNGILNNNAYLQENYNETCRGEIKIPERSLDV